MWHDKNTQSMVRRFCPLVYQTVLFLSSFCKRFRSKSLFPATFKIWFLEQPRTFHCIVQPPTPFIKGRMRYLMIEMEVGFVMGGRRILKSLWLFLVKENTFSDWKIAARLFFIDAHNFGCLRFFRFSAKVQSQVPWFCS